MLGRLAAALLALVAVYAIFIGPDEQRPRTAHAIEIEPVVWQFGMDYQAAVDDSQLPVRTVYIKTHDATEWMSTYDNTPLAVSGPGGVRRLIDHYANQGIDVIAWFVPKGGDVQTQLWMAQQVLDSGVTALYADIEPFDGFCNLDCAYLAENFWWPLRASRPNANLGVIYDPRPWFWEQSATDRWLATANAALPMCYWDLYVDQGEFGDPAGCVTKAHEDLQQWLAPGNALEYVPMLQGDSTAERMIEAIEAAESVGSTRASIWRRGVMTPDVWDALISMAPSLPALGMPTFWQWSPCPWDGCLLREESSAGVYVTFGAAKFPIPDVATLNALGFAGQPVWYVGDGMMGQVWDAPMDGTLLRELGAGGVYVVYGGAKFPIPSPEVLAALGLAGNRVWTVPAGGLNQIPDTPRDGTWLRELSSGEEWQIAGGAKFPLPSGAARDQLIGERRMYGTQYVVPDGSLQRMSAMPRDGARFRELGQPQQEWQIAAGARFALPEPRVRNQLIQSGQLEPALNVIADGGMAQLPTKPRDGVLVQELSGQGWQLTEGVKFPVPDAPTRDALLAQGHVSPQPAVVPDGSMGPVPSSNLAEGTLIKGVGSDTVYLVRCGVAREVQGRVELESLVSRGLTRGYVLTVGDPVSYKGEGMTGACEAQQRVAACAAWGRGHLNPYAAANCAH